MPDALSLVRDTEPEKEDGIQCQNCGHRCEEGTTICPLCDEPVQLPTLNEYGQRLPIGLIDDSVKPPILKKEFEIHKLDWERERAASKTWKRVMRQDGTSFLDEIVVKIAHTLESLGGVSLEKHNIEKRMQILYEMFPGDVFYLYIWMRVISLGNEFALTKVKCPACGHIIKEFPVDLSSTEINVREKVEEVYHKVTLKDGFECMGEVRTKLTLRPSTFRAMAKSDFEDDAEFFADVLKSSVIDIEGMPDDAMLTDDDIAKMTPYDRAKIRQTVDFMSGGPRWDVQIDCPSEKCNVTFDHLIDWRFSNFFKLSSPSLMPRMP